MKTLIAAATLAVSTTAASAAVYDFAPTTVDYSIDFRVNSASTSLTCSGPLEDSCSEPPEPPAVGDILSVNFSAILSGDGPLGVLIRGYDQFSFGRFFPVGGLNRDAASVNPSSHFLETGAGSYSFGDRGIGRLRFNLQEGGSASYYSNEGDGIGRIDEYSFNLTVTDFSVSGLPGQETPEVAPVPLPASAPLLAMGLGGLAWWRRRAA